MLKWPKVDGLAETETRRNTACLLRRDGVRGGRRHQGCATCQCRAARLRNAQKISGHVLSVHTRCEGVAATGYPVTAVTPSHPILDSAIDLQPVVRGFQDETERERRIPPALVDQLRAA